MLKIKDNVDLKELEKFGFRLKYNENNGLPFYYEKEFIGLNRRSDITIYIKDKELNIYIEETKEVIETLYDLIQAGLVEKVGEDNE